MSKFSFVVKRDPRTYLDGSKCPAMYHTEFGLFGFSFMTSELDEAKRFDRKKDAKEVADILGNNWHVEKIDAKGV